MFGQRFFTSDGRPPFGGLTPDMLNALARGEQVTQQLPPGVNVVEHTAYEAPNADVVADPNILELPSEIPAYARQAMSAGLLTPAPMLASAPPFTFPAFFPTFAPTSGPPRPPPAPAGPLPQAAHQPGSNQPFRLPDGTGFLFPGTLSTVHILETAQPPYENPNQPFNYRVFKLNSDTLVKDLINQVVGTDEIGGKKPSSRGVVECIETGAGAWIKGGEYFLGGKKGDEDGMKKKVEKKLSEVGWDDKRGVSNPPVWLLAFKIVE